ncbi:MAG: methylated-DNA--[protein]-cysteine S-methyltransferase [Dongiaceae bacterium]
MRAKKSLALNEVTVAFEGLNITGYFSDKGLVRLEIANKTAKKKGDAKLQKQLSAALQAAVKGKKFDLKFDLSGLTEFQLKTLGVMQKIPAGATKSYKDLAVAVKNPRAARAIGNVCNKNPIPILIPCHRVIHSNGGITGYALGVSMKKKLLNLEQKNAA